MANNLASRVILGAISKEVRHLVDPEEPGKYMYDKLKAEGVKQSSGSCANCKRIELVYEKFKDTPTTEIYHEHLTFYRSKHAALDAVGAVFDGSFLAWLLLYSFDSNRNPVWSVASTNIVTSDTPINKWSFNHVTGDS